MFSEWRSVAPATVGELDLKFESFLDMELVFYRASRHYIPDSPPTLGSATVCRGTELPVYLRSFTGAWCDHPHGSVVKVCFDKEIIEINK